MMLEKDEQLDWVKNVLRFYRYLSIEPVVALYKLREGRLRRSEYEEIERKIKTATEKYNTMNIIPLSLFNKLISSIRKMNRAEEEDLVYLMEEAVEEITQDYTPEVQQSLAEHIVKLEWKQHPEAIPHFTINRREELIEWNKKKGWIYPTHKTLKPDYVKRYIVDWWGEDIYTEAVSRAVDGDKGGRRARGSF